MTGRITDNFCPRCGGASEGICSRCRVQETEWVTLDSRVEIVVCPTCGALKEGAAWADCHADTGETAVAAVLRGVHFHPDVRSPDIKVQVTDRTSNRSIATLTITGTLYGLPVACSSTMDILWQREQCSRCSRISGGYYEGVVQVRAERRFLSPHEADTAGRIACEVENRLLSGGERLSFVSSIDELREGIDIVIGTQHLGQVLSQEITGALGGKFTTHPKLVGEKNGRPLYRITFSVRLPYYQKGDVIASPYGYLEIRDVGSSHLRVFDLTRGAFRSIREQEAGKVIGNVRDAQEALIAYTEPNAIGIIEPWTHGPQELLPSCWLSIHPGGCVRVLRDTDTGDIVLVG